MRWPAVVVIALAACGDNTVPSASDGPAWLEDSKILVDGFTETNQDCRTGLCDHDENTDLTIFNGATYLVHRTAESQVLGPNSSLHVYRSDDHGGHFDLLAIIPAPIDRDLRDPSFYVIDGQLALKAITRLPVTSERDANTDSITVNTISPDGGATWGALTPIGPEMWSFWRVRDDANGVHYSAAYEDGDQAVQLFSSIDGQTWTAGAMIHTVSADTPLETELVFQPGGHLLAFVRMDGTDAELLGNFGRLRTKVCAADPPYATFDCSQELDGARLDGPVAFTDGGRQFIIARKHFIEPADRKRTALYEITQTGGTFAWIDHGEFPSAGDTSYAGIVPIDDDHHYLVSYYSSNIAQDGPWAREMLEASDIWQATIDLSQLDDLRELRGELRGVGIRRRAEIAGLGRAQAIAEPAHGLDAHGGQADLAAQVRDVDVDQVRPGVELVAEHVQQDLGAADRLALASQQEAEQRVLARRQRKLLLVDEDVQVVVAEHEAVELSGAHRGPAARRSNARMRASSSS